MCRRILTLAFATTAISGLLLLSNTAAQACVGLPCDVVNAACNKAFRGDCVG